VSRFDKVEPLGGSFRAALAAAVVIGDVGVIKGVSLNSSGRLVQGAAALGAYKGVICADYTMAATQPIDVMTDGEIVDLPAGFTAGADIFIAVATGLLTMTATSNQYLGHMVETDRLIVRIAR
jgi:hypothetical protein